jgi:hypothetical protein
MQAGIIETEPAFLKGRRSATVGILVWKWDRADAKQ